MFESGPRWIFIPLAEERQHDQLVRPPVLHVTDVDASIRFYVDRLGFSNPWRFEKGGKTFVAQVERQDCALILSNHWPEKVGKGLMFISLNVEPETQELRGLVRNSGENSSPVHPARRPGGRGAGQTPPSTPTVAPFMS